MAGDCLKKLPGDQVARVPEFAPTGGRNPLRKTAVAACGLKHCIIRLSSIEIFRHGWLQMFLPPFGETGVLVNLVVFIDRQPAPNRWCLFN